MSLRRMRHNIELALDAPISENLQENRYRNRPTHEVTGGAVACADYWRVPRTLCTLSWLDGSVSRGFVTLRANSMSEQERAQANEDLGFSHQDVQPMMYIGKQARKGCSKEHMIKYVA